MFGNIMNTPLMAAIYQDNLRFIDKDNDAHHAVICLHASMIKAPVLAEIGQRCEDAFKRMIVLTGGTLETSF